MGIEKAFSPQTLTVLCTYQCTAACRQCCFESSPKIEGRLSRETIVARIAEARQAFPALKVVVFSGGEAMMLKDDLYAAIAFATSEGLMTRIVSNGYWGKTQRSARNAAEKLREAGLCELNISTGRDHQEWVPLSSVVNAAIAAADAGLYCLVTIENEGADRTLIDGVLRHPQMAPYVEARAITVQSNSWMPFHDDAEQRHQQVVADDMRTGCDQIFGTVVVTPHDNLSACCGLTLEHIPEMRLGKNNGENMASLYEAQLEDFMKIWLHVDGPYSIVERVLGEKATPYLKDVVHICQACAILHKTPEIREAVRARYGEFVHEVTTRLKVSMALRNRSEQVRHLASMVESRHGN